MDKKWVIIIRNSIILCVFIIIVVTFYFSRKNELKELIEKNREDWDILSIQNTMDNGDYMGKLYEHSYTSTNFPKEIFTALAIKYYIGQDAKFYDKKNMTDEMAFSKKVPKQLFDKIVGKMFGPDVSFEIEEIDYGCDISLKKDINNYYITASIPDSCGVFGADEEFYFSHISNYYKKNNDIIVNYKIGFIKKNTKFDEEYENEKVSYILYQDKTKENLIQKNYDFGCIYGNGDKKCYENLQDYEVILRKASDGKYYFYQINKL